MTLPYLDLFLGLLAAYMIYSAVARLDPRYPIAGALVLLVATAVVDAAGAVSQANTLAEYVFLLLAAGVVLLLVDHVRSPGAGAGGEPAVSGSAPAAPEAAQSAHEGDRTSQDSLQRG